MSEAVTRLNAALEGRYRIESELCEGGMATVYLADDKRLTEGTRWPDGRLRGGLYIDLPDWRREDWAYVLVRARTSEGIRTFGIEFNLREGPLRLDSGPAAPFQFRGEYVNGELAASTGGSSRSDREYSDSLRL